MRLMKYVEDKGNLLFPPYKVVFESDIIDHFKIGFYLLTLDELKSHVGEGRLYFWTRHFHEYVIDTMNKIDKSHDVHENGSKATCRSFKCYHVYHPSRLNFKIKGQEI